MRSHDVPGFILRTEAVKKYGRSKASFIRDFDKAFESGDTDFLNNFRLYLNDGTVIEGPDASKEENVFAPVQATVGVYQGVFP